MPEILMPKLSDSMEEGTIVRWLVEDGSEVRIGEELAEIETDKAVMAYEAEAAGTLSIVVAEGETAAVGAVIGRVAVGGEAPALVAAAGASAVATVDERRPPRMQASPVARRVAQRLGIDLATLVGSGPNGRIVKRDVEGAAAAANGAVVAARSGGKGAVEVRPLSRVQVTIARRMSEAKATMPEFTLTTEVDMDAAVELRARFKALGQDVVPSFNDFVVRAAALALRAHPRANAAYRDGHFEQYDRVNVGVAVAAEDALLVPTVMDADRRSLGEIATETRRLAAGARAGTLTAAELSNGTFSVSNLGMFGVTAFTAVLNPPQAAILAVGALRREAVAVRGDELGVGRRMTITLTCDHRILYGADAAAFLADIRAALEQPLRLVL